MNGLYILTDPGLIPDTLLVDRVREAILGGATAVQYRDKRTDYEGHRDRADALRTLTRELDVLLIINDDPRLAADVAADGVHLGQDDGDIAGAREILGPSGIIGVSCYDDLDRALGAQRQGADYVAFGSFFPTRTKTAAASPKPELLRRAKRELEIPIVAIGGITPDNGASLVAAGADALAVVSAVFGHEDPKRAAERFKSILT